MKKISIKTSEKCYSLCKKGKMLREISVTMKLPITAVWKAILEYCVVNNLPDPIAEKKKARKKAREEKGMVCCGLQAKGMPLEKIAELEKISKSMVIKCMYEFKIIKED